ncbi:putative ATP-dependent helicase YqhH [Geobacter sp. OR-1]|uniref:phospholipase D-like domain-containing anti-phage protein n=1 Tax=Geobacter sp. OR-1 TaxID=1266765 RepID=UPI000542F74E|nr:phospholipase D-like domain-containing anti-phage protein [Geobacter sp. OR-1]GAM11826.1 putative ATP-dependent helicase YqhH [Geobacter sp. OR-1]
MSVQRYTSRLQKLDESFLTPRLTGAKKYDRIAGYFSSSILEVAGEVLEKVDGEIRIICNSGLEPQDVITAKAAQAAMRREWCASEPEKLGELAKGRFNRLFQFLQSGKLKVKVLPDEHFGLIHGKAGVITLPDGSKTAFMGSANESKSAWQLNYEIVWEDDTKEAIDWVQDEFDALWSSPNAVALADFVIEDIERISKREVIGSIEKWRENPVPSAPIIESPVYRKEVGLWEHQKFFVNLAFKAHTGPHGARYILADQVGLGKTLQLAMSAELMALAGDKPVLVLAPRTVIWQWQDELRNLLDMPSAVWNGKQWVDENGLEYPSTGPESIRNCPRWVGIVSTGLIIQKTEVANWLASMQFECVILDEAHKARRKKIAKGKEYESSDPNNLLAFIQDISANTRSMLLATATPVQLHPVEVWDLLEALSRGSDAVLGAHGSPWRSARKAIELVMGDKELPQDDIEMWEWLRNPFPPTSEGVDYTVLRRSLKLAESDAIAVGSKFQALSSADKKRLRGIFANFVKDHNPFIRHIVLRTREYLETTINPATGETYLKPVKVKLHGERDEDAVHLPPFLKEAYHHAETFCELISSRMNSGFLKTLLLRRVGSSIEAGKLTAQKMLTTWNQVDIEESEDEDLSELDPKTLLPAEQQALSRFIKALEANQSRDPKYAVVLSLLKNKGWLEQGCIIFSQFYDSIWWLANQLTNELPGEKIGIYAGANKSGILLDGLFEPVKRDVLKEMVRCHELRLLLGTDAASEGLNLQRLGTLINLDLPWNPSRLEQRKGRIQRIGQIRDEVDIYNMRYKDSVEDRVHELLSGRLEDISKMFGQLPDILEDVWINVAIGEIEQAKQTIDAVPNKHPFELRYHKIDRVDWETCEMVLDNTNRKKHLSKGWR